LTSALLPPRQDYSKDYSPRLPLSGLLTPMANGTRRYQQDAQSVALSGPSADESSG